MPNICEQDVYRPSRRAYVFLVEVPHDPHRMRYIERVQRVPYRVALARLIDASEVARPAKRIEPGIWEYRTGKPIRLRLRVSTAGPGLPQLVTVLKPHAKWRVR